MIHCLLERCRSAAAIVTLAVLASAYDASASSHMDAPLITLDDAANTTDVYAFVSEIDGSPYLSTALAVYPFEEPGIGPNKHNFDDNVRYEIHVSLGNDVAAGRATLSYRFDFTTEFANPDTILQSYVGVVQPFDAGAQSYPGANLTQRYRVTRVDRRISEPEMQATVLGTGVVPPNNQGIATPLYNQGNDGTMPAKDGVASVGALDPYTSAAIKTLSDGSIAFAGQRDDGFYADIQAIFDLLNLRSGQSRFDSQGGYNVHTISLNIPLEELGGDMQLVGVYASTSRRRTRVLRRSDNTVQHHGRFVQVARQGNPLFNEAFVAVADKDLYGRTTPENDATLFRPYAETPELAALINAILFGGDEVAPEMNRSDIASIFIPDTIKVDLSTGPARLAGSGPDHPTNPDDDGYSRLSIFGGDVLPTQISSGLLGDGNVPGGWPNGRRFGDDVIDIGVSALLSDLRNPASPMISVADGIDNVSANDIGYNKVVPYAATPLNGRNHGHH